MKRIIALTLLFIFLLTGCTNEKVLFNTYTSTVKDINTLNVSSDHLSQADLFAKDLCVIPVDYQMEKDSNLTSAASFIVDTTSNEILYEDNVYQNLYPASITKIVTAYVALKYGNLSDVVTISKNAANITEYGAKLCGFKEGDTIRLDALLTSLLVYSGNDAGIAVAEHIAGSEEAFADMMNEEMKKLGAVDSHFVNAHGLHDDNHYTTIYDLYLVFQELVKDSTFLSMIQLSSYNASYQDASGNEKTALFTNTNRYLKSETKAPEGVTVIGGKTGTTNKAGSCLILYSKAENGHNYISVILKASTGDELFSQMNNLLDKISSKK